ncbi:hypothetical protein D3H65_02755 [Paraflavitalea soli]|uniref:Alginate lyase domain-containing protein n=1 Tax=Paraflavitalea soli TaxID=2315862 RepID=A0A3B7MIA2_9BACT|nr:alginate lyase family protein [Paraflavitalea soli]AXY72949.1 hypothetical protein D3H65_02755 [Paraflavitalea soli]
MRPLLPVLLVVFTLPVIALTASAQLPEVFLVDAQHLARVKQSVQAKDKGVEQPLLNLLQEADKLLEMKPVSVMDKGLTPVSGNKHDYMSQAPYFWYDSSKPNGLPYLRRDGERNPEIYKITDRSNLGKLENAAHLLSLAWYFTGKEQYADKAASLLRCWFLDGTTRMNPHLNYGQAIPGINDGRGIGIIETIALTNIADAAGLLKGSKAWPLQDHQALQQWYKEYLQWMLTSKNGKEEHAAKNNHGTWYYVQVVDFALFCGDKAKAHELAEESKKRMDSQLTAEGQMPLELERTAALGYSTFNLRAWFTLAGLASQAGTDLWNYTTSKGAGLRTALDWLTPYAFGEKAWTWQQINRYNKEDMLPVVAQAGTIWKAPAYTARAEQLVKTVKDPAAVLLYGR